MISGEWLEGGVGGEERFGAAEFDEAGFGPEAFVAGLGGDEGAVAAVFGGDDGDEGVVADCGLFEGREGDERIVLRGDDQRGTADSGDDAEGAGGCVVVVGAIEAAEVSGDSVVEAADGVYVRECGKFGGRINFRIEAGFVSHAALEPPHEVTLVDKVVAALECVGAGCEIESGCDCDAAAEAIGRGVAQFPGHLQH